MKSVLLIIFTAYILICIILYIFQKKLLYFPTPAITLNNEKEITFTINQIKLSGWIINEGNEKALLYYGGNAESIEENIRFFKTILPNYTVYLVNYRGYGKSQGSPTQNTLFSDALAIYDVVQKYHKSISIIGRSLGSGVATYLASQKEIEKLLLITPYDSVENVAQGVYFYVPVKWLLKDKYNSMLYIKDIKVKTLIIYASEDEVINPKRTQNLIRYFKKEQLHVLKINNANHNDIALFDEYTKKINAFFNY